MERTPKYCNNIRYNTNISSVADLREDMLIERAQNIGSRIMQMNLNEFPLSYVEYGMLKNVIRFMIHMHTEMGDSGKDTIFDNFFELIERMTGVPEMNIRLYANSEPMFRTYLQWKKNLELEEIMTRGRRTKSLLDIEAIGGQDQKKMYITENRLRRMIILFPSAVFTIDDFIKSNPQLSDFPEKVYTALYDLVRNGLIYQLRNKDSTLYDNCLYIKETRCHSLKPLQGFSVGETEYMRALYRGQNTRNILEQLEMIDFDVYIPHKDPNCIFSICNILSMGILQSPKFDIDISKLKFLKGEDVATQVNKELGDLVARGILLGSDLTSGKLVKSTRNDKFEGQLPLYNIRDYTELRIIQNAAFEKMTATTGEAKASNNMVRKRVIIRQPLKRKVNDVAVKQEVFESCENEGTSSTVNYVWNDNLEMKIPKLEEEETEVDIKPDNLAVQ